LKNIASNPHGFLRQLQELRLILRGNLSAAVSEVNSRLSENVVVGQFPETLVIFSDGCLVRRNSSLVGSGLLLLGHELLLLLLKLLLLSPNLLLIRLSLLLDWSYSGMNIFGRLQAAISWFCAL
jgi:hypothetical protein